MQYWGKMLGIILGCMSGANFWIIVFSLIIVHLIDKISSASISSDDYFTMQQTRQNIFFVQSFRLWVI